MFDSRLRPMIDPALQALATRLQIWGVTANALTSLGMVIGILSGTLIAYEHYLAGLVLVLINRLLDGLDGALARRAGPTDFGGYLDIVADFVFYVSVPLGFGLADPENLLPALALVASFTLTGISFLAFAAIASKRGLETRAHGPKSFFYSTGIAEGAETILVFVLMCIWPVWFAVLAYFFAGLCFLTVIQRSILARLTFRAPADRA
jgi:phosphatidylglycerophosphate synthase